MSEELVAVVNPRGPTLHKPRCQVHFHMRDLVYIESWASAEGRHYRSVSKLCKVCNPTPPALVKEDDDE